MTIIYPLVISVFTTMNDAPPLADLAVFVAVVEAEGFSAAARRLSVSKAMVSTAVARLEAQLGVRLFQRTTRRLTVTEEGARAFPHAQRAMAAARDAAEAAALSRTSPRGTLKVNAPMSFGLLHVVPALGAFAAAYPEVDIDLVLDDRMLDLVEGGFDVALRIGVLGDSSLVAQRIGRNRMALVAHADYLSRAGAPKAPGELVGHSLLQYAHAPSQWTMTRGKTSVSVRVRPKLKANSSLALHQAVSQGLGIARMPLFVVGNDLARGRLMRVLDGWDLPEAPIQIVTTTRQHQPQKTKAFVEFFRSRLGDPPYWEAGAASDRPRDIEAARGHSRKPSSRRARA